MCWQNALLPAWSVFLKLTKSVKKANVTWNTQFHNSYVQFNMLSLQYVQVFQASPSKCQLDKLQKLLWVFVCKAVARQNAYLPGTMKDSCWGKKVTAYSQGSKAELLVWRLFRSMSSNWRFRIWEGSSRSRRWGRCACLPMRWWGPCWARNTKAPWTSGQIWSRSRKRTSSKKRYYRILSFFNC